MVYKNKGEREVSEIQLNHFKSRKERYPKKKILIPFWDIWCISTCIILMYGSFQHSNTAGLVTFVLSLPILLFRYIHKNALIISILYFILLPLTIAIGVLFLLVMTVKDADLLKQVESFSNVYVLFGIPIISLCLLLYHRNKDDFLKKAKVALEFNNCLFIVITLWLVLYAYEESDFKFLSPVINFEKVAELGFQDRDAFNWLCQTLSFPFLVSTAVCKWLLELFLYRRGM